MGGTDQLTCTMLTVDISLMLCLFFCLQFGLIWSSENKRIWVNGAIDLFGTLHLGVNMSIGVGCWDYELSLNVLDLIALEVGVHADIPIPNIPIVQPNMPLQILTDVESISEAIIDPAGAFNNAVDEVKGYGNDIATQISNLFDPDKSVGSVARTLQNVAVAANCD